MKSRMMRSLLLSIMLCVLARPAAAETIRVLAAQAAVHLNPDPNSLTLATIPAGSVLELNARQGDWYVVWIPGEREGSPRRLGYLALRDAERSDGGEPHRAPQAASPEQFPAETRSLPPPPKTPSGDLDGLGGVTFNLPAARAFVVLPGITADSGDHRVLSTFGFNYGKWFGEKRVSGVFVELTVVDGGSAVAEIGSANHADATFTLASIHGGWQYQYPGRRIRPYVEGGIGVCFQKTVANLTLLGTPIQAIDQTDHFLSFIAGGGVRVMFTERFGARVGVDALSIKVTDEGYLNYGRFVGGTFLSF